MPPGEAGSAALEVVFVTHASAICTSPEERDASWVHSAKHLVYVLFQKGDGSRSRVVVAGALPPRSSNSRNMVGAVQKRLRRMGGRQHGIRGLGDLRRCALERRGCDCDDRDEADPETVYSRNHQFIRTRSKRRAQGDTREERLHTIDALIPTSGRPH
jgi:hypothetical protein